MTPLRKLLTAAASVAAVAVPLLPATAGAGTAVNSSANRISVAVIGDVPYGVAQEATVGSLVEVVDADPKVRAVVHVGDTKSGSTTCSDERSAAALATLESFEDPVVYTPGDNEWTDCHRANNGSYDPLERLSALRSSFFAEPGSTLGRRPMAVDHQAAPFVENVRWIESRVAFASLHVVGSDNGRAPWTGRATMTPEQAAEVDARIAAAVAWVDETFDAAETRDLEGVVLAMQADTWFRGGQPSFGQQAVVQRIVERTSGFDGQVLVLQGDSHVFVADRPTALPNLQRVVVHGETLPYEYLRLTIDPKSRELFSWERVTIQG